MLLASVVWLSGCSQATPDKQQAASSGNGTTAATPASNLASPNPERNAYFGDLHVHTSWSFDAYINGTQTTPQDAYDWAQG